jgi:hypothetical protein
MDSYTVTYGDCFFLILHYWGDVVWAVDPDSLLSIVNLVS